MTRDALVPIEHPAAGAGTDSLEASLARAASLLSTSNAADLLVDVISNPSGRARVSRLVSDIDHVGFIADPRDDASIDAAARHAGFDLPPRAFPSAIIARELGELLGRSTLPTTILQLHCRRPDGARGMAEVVVPHDVSDQVVREWRRTGVAAHVAFRVEHHTDLVDIGAVMTDEGFVRPAFVGQGPLANPAENITIAYFDRRRDAEYILRVEFCHYGVEA